MSSLCERCGLRTAIKGLGVCEQCFDNTANQAPYPVEEDD